MKTLLGYHLISVADWRALPRTLAAKRPRHQAGDAAGYNGGFGVYK